MAQPSEETSTVLTKSNREATLLTLLAAGCGHGSVPERPEGSCKASLRSLGDLEEHPGAPGNDGATCGTIGPYWSIFKGPFGSCSGEICSVGLPFCVGYPCISIGF